jgi:hypothetical protein
MSVAIVDLLYLRKMLLFLVTILMHACDRHARGDIPRKPPSFSVAILYIRYWRFLPAETVKEAKELVEGKFEYVCYCDLTVTHLYIPACKNMVA